MVRKKIHCVILFLLLAGSGAAAKSLVVGYYPSWSKGTYPYNVIMYENLTHIAHAFLIPNADGSLGGVSGFAYPELIQAAHAHGVKVVVSFRKADIS